MRTHVAALFFACGLAAGAARASDDVAVPVDTAGVAAPIVGDAPVADAAASTADGCVDLAPYNGGSIEALPAAPPVLTGPLRVGEIDVHRLPVFDEADPEQNLWLYRSANRFRAWAGLDTRPETIAALLHFREGEVVEPRTVAESERALRGQLYLFDARVLPRRRCGERVDFDVVTRDLWTLLPRIDIGRSGGRSNLGVGIVDSNVFGGGARFSAGYRETVDRAGWDLSWSDPNFLGNHHVLNVALADSDDGYLQSLRTGLPFYSFTSRFSWTLGLERAEREESLYFRGDEFAEFERRTERAEVSLGWSPGLQGRRQPRFGIGFVHDEQRFARSEDEPGPADFPRDRVLDYAFVSFESVEDDFELTRNLDRLQRTEDLYTGLRYGVLLGYSTQGADRVVFRADFADAQHFGDRALLRYGVVAEGTYRRDIDETENFEVRSIVRYRETQSPRWSLFAAASYTYTDNLTPDRQLLLGGDTGLRGYPLRYQLGDRRFLASIEERYFSDLYLFKLVRVGGAVFADVGRAWFPSGPSEDDFGVLGDVGFGLRLESTRTQNGAVMHIDVAFPLVDGPDVDPVQLLISVKQSL